MPPPESATVTPPPMARPAAHGAQGCHALAWIGGTGAVVVSALFFRGWAVTEHRLDIVPALVAAILSAVAVNLLGRVDRRPQAVYAAFFAASGIAAGLILAKDVFGLVAAQSGTPADAGTWLARLTAAWTRQTPLEQAVNAASFALAPILAALVVPAGRMLNVLTPRIPRVDAASDESAASRHIAAAPRPGWRLAAAVWSVALMAAVCWRSDTERDGFALLTFPCETFHAANPLPGFCHLLGGRPIMMESVPALEQVGWFSGAVRSDNNFRFLRAGYAFLAVHAAPLLGAGGALWTINVLSWIICLIVVWRLTTRLFRDEAAAALAVCFAAAGIGFAVHVHSFTPHLAGFALYYVGVLWLLSGRFGQTSRPWEAHRALGLASGLMGAVYNVGPMLVAVYLLVGWRRQRWLYLFGGAALALSVRPIWRFILPALGINVADVDAEYLAAALHAWREWWQAGVATFLGHAFRHAVESATACESPLVLVMGLIAACVAIPTWRERWFGSAVLSAPVLACTVFAPVAGARGYIVYGMSVWLFACVGGGLAAGLRRGGIAAVLTAIVSIAALAGQTAWGTAHLWGWLGPAKTYFLGWDDGWPVLRHAPAEVRSLTDHEPAPAAFGGSASLVDAGAVVTPPTQPIVRKSRVLAWLARFPFFFALALLSAAVARCRTTRRALAVALVLLVPVGSELSLATLHDEPHPFDMSRGASINGGESATWRVRVSPHVLSEARRRVQVRQVRTGIYLRTSGPIELTCRAGDQRVTLLTPVQFLHECADQQSAESLLGQTEWVLTIHNPGLEPVWITGWQRPDLVDLELRGTADGSASPAAELRLIRTDDGTLEFAAF